MKIQSSLVSRGGTNFIFLVEKVNELEQGYCWVEGRPDAKEIVYELWLPPWLFEKFEHLPTGDITAKLLFVNSMVTLEKVGVPGTPDGNA
jgi:hypothetical protein